ncbi:MAG: HAMP domain-containing sensor histidine kinase [Kofleriaceae bacterium]
MSRGSIRRRFLLGSIASAVLALALFAAGSFAFVYIDDDAELDIRQGEESYRGETIELILGAMLIAGPLALIGAVVTAVIVSRRSARPVEDAIRAARETTAHDLRRSLPIPERDDELRDLVVALNELFIRLDDGFGALARFAADASHELRTPIAVMATELEVALRHPRPVGEWEATARNTLDELLRVSQLVEGLLTLARAGADAPASRIAVDLVECIDAVVAQVSSIAEAAHVSLSGPDDPLDDRITGNSVMVETAIRNLVENAIAAAPNGRVRVGVEVRERTLVVVVDDDGPGLSADPESLFIPFQRGTNVSADRGTRRAGIGLGLTIARRIATSHGGTVIALPSPLGGARFELGLPRRRA